MKQIYLPIKRHYSTPSVDLEEANKNLRLDQRSSNSFGVIDFGVAGKELDQARINGGVVIWSTICLEEKLEKIITEYIFHPIKETQPYKSKSFFVNKIVKADFITYSTKKRLVVEIVNSGELLKGREKNDLERFLKKVMDYRNAFAHGSIEYISGKGCILKSGSANVRDDTLSDDYWKSLEDIFKKCHLLADNIVLKLCKNE